MHRLELKKSLKVVPVFILLWIFTLYFLFTSKEYKPISLARVSIPRIQSLSGCPKIRFFGLMIYHFMRFVAIGRWKVQNP